MRRTPPPKISINQHKGLYCKKFTIYIKFMTIGGNALIFQTSKQLQDIYLNSSFHKKCVSEQTKKNQFK